jgi:hypothetical protein
MPSPDNADSVLSALKKFGAPLHGLTSDDLQKPDTLFQIGVAPRRIDIITGASGLDFESAFDNSISTEIEGIKLNIPSLDDLICNKKASGRLKDIADAEVLENLKSSEQKHEPDCS